MTTLAIVGPTAVGKTALSIELAKLIGGPGAVEIISADAMQLYRGMDIGTAKITPEEREGITHHQLDVLDPREEASVAAYQHHAREDHGAITARGKTPLIVGGSGLYVSALLDEIDFPGTDPQLRAELTERANNGEAEALHAELAQLDPVSAATIDVRNVRRVVRALEVNLLTGQSFQPRFPRHTFHLPATIIGITDDRVALNSRIEKRTAAMFDTGLVAETAELRRSGMGKTASKATGYREAGAVLDGELTEAEAREAVSAATRKLVSKQLKWFRSDPRIRWYQAAAPALLAATIAEDLEESGVRLTP